MIDLNNVTVQDFKDLFVRDFLYLPVWLSTTTYNTGQEVYYEPTALFYRCLNNGVTSLPTDAGDWVLFNDEINNYVLDADITRAFQEAKVTFNQGLFPSEDEIRLAYLYLVAHYLVNDLKTALQGIESAGSQIVQSRSVGSVSESYAIPDAWTASPIYNFYTQSQYGLKYLNLLLPQLVGNVQIATGATNA